MVWGFQARFWVGSIDAIAESDRCWASSMTSRAIFLTPRNAPRSRARKKIRLPLRKRISSLPAARLMPWSGSTRPLMSGRSTIAHRLSNVSLMTLKCWAVHTMRMPGVRAARWIATQPMS